MDICFIAISYILTNIFLTSKIEIMTESYITTTLISVVVYISLFMLIRVYRSITEYTGAREYVIYFGTCIVSSVVVSLLGLAVKFETFGIKENLLTSFFIAGFMILARVSFRFLTDYINNNKIDKKQTHNLLIIGAGARSSRVIKEMLPRMDANYNVIGIIDDNISKKNSSINGITIIGGREEIVTACEANNVDFILFAISDDNIDKKQKKDILNICSQTKAQVKIVPNIKEILLSNKPLEINKFQDVEIEDLLGRDPIKLEDKDIKEYIKDKVVLVTGGGGSIGSELCRQVASFSPKKLLMLDIYENTLYETELEIRKKYPNLDITAIIASIRDSKRINELFEMYKPEIVFHAAAHKHVPLMETSPVEAIKNNVFGTYNVAVAASNFGVDRFILVSTDKAVNPTSVMGATKRICEMIIQMQNTKSETNFVAVRFGNVLGSNGSVIPIFKKQIAQGGPVTVTHKDITRYFMTIPEAVGLILQAITFAEGGEIFVLDMGEPVKIYDLAHKMIRLSGFEPDVDINIEVTGLRPGEKLYEELLVSEEGLSKTLHDKIMVTKIIDFDAKEVEEDLALLRNVVNSNIATDNVKIKKIIKKIVPTFIEEKEHTAKHEQKETKKIKGTNQKGGKKELSVKKG